MHQKWVRWAEEKKTKNKDFRINQIYEKYVSTENFQEGYRRSAATADAVKIKYELNMQVVING